MSTRSSASRVSSVQQGSVGGVQATMEPLYSSPAQVVQGSPTGATTSSRAMLTAMSRPATAPAPGTVSIVSGQSFNSMADMVRAMSVPSRLIEQGYTPIGYIVVRDADGSYVRYALTYNRRGVKVLVDLDVQGYVITTTRDMTVSAEADPTSHLIERLHGEEADKCALSSNCSLAFLCSEGVCTLRPEIVENNAHLVEQAHGVVKDSDQNTATLVSDTQATYPLVALSLIESNPQEAERLVSRATEQVRSVARRRMAAEAEAPARAAKELAGTLAEMVYRHTSLVNYLVSSIDELRGFLANYDLSNPADLEKRRINLVEIQQREQILQGLVGDYADFQSITQSLQEYNAKFTEFSNKLEQALQSRDQLVTQPDTAVVDDDYYA